MIFNKSFTQKPPIERSVAEFIPYSHHVTPNIIATRNGDYLSIWKISGRSHHTAELAEVFQWVHELNQVLKGLQGPVALWTHIVRRGAPRLAQDDFSDPICAQLDRHYQAQLQDTEFMINELYLSVILKAPALARSPWTKQSDLKLSARQAAQDAQVAELNRLNAVLKVSLAAYGPRLLGLYEERQHVFSEALEFLGFLINGTWSQFPVGRQKFSETLCLSRPLFSLWGELGELRGTGDSHYFSILEVVDYDKKTEPGQLNILLESHFPFVLSQSFSLLSKRAAQELLQKQQSLLIDAKDVAFSQIAEIDEALNQLVAGEFVMGEHHATLKITGPNPESVRRRMHQAQASLLQVGVTAKVCDLSLEPAFWAQLPGNWAYRPRALTITSLNFWCFASLHNFMSGKAHGNPWGPALCVFKSLSRTPLYFNFHASAHEQTSLNERVLGNTAIIGQSGSGKTVLLNFLMMQAQKYQPTMVCFDKDRGLELCIRAMSGRYWRFVPGKPSGLNPLQLEPTAKNIDFLSRWLQSLLSPELTLTHAEVAELDQGLNTLMFELKPEDRTLSVLLQSLPNPHDSQSVHGKLSKWAGSGSWAWLFDNPRDDLNIENPIIGFDVTEFLEHPQLRGPLISYLTHRSEALLDGRRFIYVFDEFWKFLQDKSFQAFILNKQKTIRKQNGLFVYATQEPNDALVGPLASTLVQQCATLICLPNPKATRSDYIEGLKLSPAEFDWVKDLSPSSRQFLVKQHSDATLAELALQGLPELALLSGSLDKSRLLDQIFIELGDCKPEVWLPIFYERLKTAGLP